MKIILLLALRRSNVGEEPLLGRGVEGFRRLPDALGVEVKKTVSYAVAGATCLGR